MSEKYIHRTCPCFGWDIEGIQTWLEDMAARGFHLEADGAFLGLFSFLVGEPRPVRYRLTPVKQKRGFFDDTDAPDLEEQEYSEKCGWEYVLRHGSFYIYRATDPAARPLHTDPAVQALALKGLTKQRRQVIVSEVLFWAIYLGLQGSSVVSIFRSAAVIGPVFVLAAAGLVCWAAFGLLAFPLRLGQYRKRLLSGDLLENRKPWEKTVLRTRLLKLVPWVLFAALIVSGLNSWALAYERVPLEQLSKPFPGVSELFPGAEQDRMNMGDYNTGVAYGNVLSENLEWNESCSVEGYHVILRVQCHETRWEWLARGLAEDFYRYERFRYNRKRFEDLEAPETELDSVRVFSSYGVTHVLIQHGNIVMDAVVNISGKDQQNHWQLWLEQAEEILLKEWTVDS